MALLTPAEVQEREERKIFLEETLTSKQVQFCYEYLIDFNATQAAIRAGYSERSAGTIGDQNMQKLAIMELLTILKDERIARARKTGDDVLQELENISFSRMNRIVRVGGDGDLFVKDSDELDDADAAAIESISVVHKKHGKETNVKLYPKIPALTLLAKQHKVCTDKLSIGLDAENLPDGVTINFVSAKGDE